MPMVQKFELGSYGSNESIAPWRIGQQQRQYSIYQQDDTDSPAIMNELLQVGYKSSLQKKNGHKNNLAATNCFVKIKHP